MNEVEQTKKPKVTPGDFFLYLGMLITLYVSAVALITFLFAVIDISLADVQNYYQDSRTAIAWSLSIFIVFYPVLMILVSVALKQLIQNAEKAKMGLRKWFIFLTLFVTGLTVAIDLIVLINFFLSGEELTLAFLLKVVAIILVAGTIFLFAYKDLKGVFIAKHSLFKVFRAVASVLIIALVIIGLFLIGSPSDLRSERHDRERVEDLHFIQSEIIAFWQSKEQLPVDLEELNDPLRGFEVPVDPETEADYGYTILEDKTFEICATFGTEQRDHETRFYISGFEHGVGEECFERNIDADKFPPIKE